MRSTKGTVLIADDEVFNLEILSEHLEETGYGIVSANDGQQAWSLLERDPHLFDAILLDRAMPNMDGMEVLHRIKAHSTLRMLPVIMQTAKAAREDILIGLQGGAYYYLTKPFDRETLLAIVKTAVTDYRNYRNIQKEAAQNVRTLSLMHRGEFRFRTLEEGRTLAALLANASPRASRIAVGLSELISNAVEHGNLGISYREKSELLENGKWYLEIERRLSDPEHAHKEVTVSFERSTTELCFQIQDQGEGFDWRAYQEISPERVFDNHGRGIAIARMLSFDRIEYQGNGNRVLATIRLEEEKQPDTFAFPPPPSAMEG